MLLVVVLLIGGYIGYKYWQYSLVHISTDDATLSNDVIQIAPQVSGTIQQVCVQDNQLVKKGELLVQLDDATYRASVAQAKANLDAAIAQAQGAGVSVNLTYRDGRCPVDAGARAGVPVLQQHRRRRTPMWPKRPWR